LKKEKGPTFKLACQFPSLFWFLTTTATAASAVCPVSRSVRLDEGGGGGGGAGPRKKGIKKKVAAALFFFFYLLWRGLKGKKWWEV
jgi:hypothetical protein